MSRPYTFVQFTSFQSRKLTKLEAPAIPKSKLRKKTWPALAVSWEVALNAIFLRLPLPDYRTKCPCTRKDCLQDWTITARCNKLSCFRQLCQLAIRALVCLTAISNAFDS